MEEQKKLDELLDKKRIERKTVRKTSKSKIEVQNVDDPIANEEAEISHIKYPEKYSNRKKNEPIEPDLDNSGQN